MNIGECVDIIDKAIADNNTRIQAGKVVISQMKEQMKVLKGKSHYFDQIKKATLKGEIYEPDIRILRKASESSDD